MSDDQAIQLAARYNEHAAAYADLWAPVLRIASRRLIRELSTVHAPDHDGSTRLIVDVGAGAGTIMPELLTAFPGSCVLGLDRSPGMLALAPRERGMLHAVADARQLPVATASVDVVLMAFMLFHLPEPADGLREARRVLRPGGCVGTITWGGDMESVASSAWAQSLDEHGATQNAAAVTARDEPLSTGQKLQDLMLAAGFAGARGWTEELSERIDLDHLLQPRTHMGSEKTRFDSLSEPARQSCLSTARRRMEAMEPDDFILRGPVVFAVAS
jgi:ubiquinone/menaquinone biosynthesis C-methylase UbiE